MFQIVLGPQLNYLGCVSRTVGWEGRGGKRERERERNGIETLHLPVEIIKMCSELELLPVFEPIMYQS